MIFGSALAEVFDGLTIAGNGNTYPIKNNYGKQEDLDRFIAISDQKRVSKFPLLFWVTSKVTDRGDCLRCTSNLVIMVNTQTEMLSKVRKIATFDTFITPLYDKIIPLIHKSELKVIGDRRTAITYEDVANYGLGSGSLGSKRSDKSIITDFIDARVINLTLEFYK